MSDNTVHDELPQTVVLLLKRLEDLTGHMPVARVVTFILMVGLLLTVLVVGLVWAAERHRAHQVFEATAERLHGLMQDRLDERVSQARQFADWANSTANRSSGKRQTWRAGGLSWLSDADASAARVATTLSMEPAQAARLSGCLGGLNSGMARLCEVPSPASDTPTWFLVIKQVTPAPGWTLLALRSTDLVMAMDDGLFWHAQARLEAASGLHPGPAPTVSAAFELQVPGVGQRLPVRVSGEPRIQTLSEFFDRQISMLVAAMAGLLFTLAALHVYLMLISTRRRARDMAHEMSMALQRTQSRNQAVMDTAPDAIIITDAAGKVSWCNQATTSLFGRTLDDLAGQPIGAILPDIGASDVDEWFSLRGFANRVIGVESNGVRAEGTAFPVAMSASRVQVDGETILTFIVRDTTDAKWAEQELLLRERALGSSADGVIITSMTLPNQPIIYVNEAFARITGYEADEVLGLNCKMLQRDDTEQPAIQTMREAIRKGESCKVVVRNYRKDGTLFYNDLAISPVLSPEGVLTHYVGVQTDITERIAAEQVLHLRTERLNAVFDLSPDGFVVLDRRGEVSIVNPSFERMTGMRAGDLVGRSLAAFEEELSARCKPAEPDERSAVALQDGAVVYDDGSKSSRQLLQLHTPTVRTLVRRVRHGAQDNETVMYFRDITSELEVDRMKSEFLAMAAHELRTPMVSIFGFTELLLKRPFSDERRQDMLGTIHRQASILINLVNELLDLARIEARRGKDFNRRLQPIGPLIDQVLEGLKVPGDRRKVRLHLAAADWQVWADAEKLSQAVLNVLSNAYKYSPHGGEIHLRVYPGAQAQQLCIEVEDHGIGMTPEQLGRVFERFFRADPSGNIPGTGLGMSLVKEIVALHQGEVAVDSVFGQGTMVRITLPAQAGAVALPATEGMNEDNTKVSTG